MEPSPSTSAHPSHGPLHFEGAEGPSEWTTRTFLSPGVDNRADAGAWHTTMKSARSGNASWTFQDESVNRYRDSATFDLHSPTLDITGLERPTLRFHYRGESEAQSGDDFAWGPMVRGTLEPMGSTDAPAPEWTEVTVDLSGRGPTIDWLFRFEADFCGGDTPLAVACGEGSFEGYYVDDIEVFDAAVTH